MDVHVGRSLWTKEKMNYIFVKTFWMLLVNRNVQLGACPSWGISWFWEVAEPIRLVPVHWLTDTFTLSHCVGRLVLVLLPLQQAQLLAFPSQGNDLAFPLRVFWVALFLGHVVQGEHGSKLLFHVGRPAVSIDGLRVTNQLLKTKGKTKI